MTRPKPPYDIAALKKELDGLRLEENPALVKQKSRDFYWYSPVLKRELDHVTADIVVSPTSEEEVVRTVKACYGLGIPLTPRGTGTGNYGQAMPLSGGVLLNLSEMNKVKEIRPGRVISEPGTVIQKLDNETRAHSGQELRMHPSTYATASIAGFVAGGSGGVGSVNWGGLRSIGNVLSLKVVTAEAEPRVLELKGWDLMKAMHAYGTNGIITEVEMPLDHAYPWVDVMLGFDDWMKAVRFSDALGSADGLLVKEIAPVAAPAPYDYFLRHRRFLKREQSVVVTMVAEHSMDAFLAFCQRQKAEILYRADTATDEEKKGLPPSYELSWNHTTLRALRVDPSITYLQVGFRAPDHVKLVETTSKIFGDECMGHLEMTRQDGKLNCAGLPLVRFTSEERLAEIIRIYEDNGCLIFNPHRYTLEEGGMKQTDELQLEFKRQVDPKGLLNPGKMIAWEDPSFDFAARKNYLFPGLTEAA